MRWFAIFVPRETGACGVQPTAARTLWDGERPLWLVEDWPDSEVRELRAGDRRVAVLGPCAAGDDDLRAVITRWQIPARPWPGSYTIIVQDAAYTEIHTDLAWTCPIYAARRPEGTYLASSLLPLAALTGWRLDHAWLAVRLLCPDVPHLFEGRSPFTGVEILPPGTCATITADGWHATRTWTPGKRSFADGAAQLRTALVAGVATRVAPVHTITTDLSGGLDSTSLTFLAAHAASPGTGDGGDAVLTAPLCYLADLARKGQVRLLLGHAAAWAQLLNRSALGLLVAAARQARRQDAGSTAVVNRVLAENDRLAPYPVRASQLLGSEFGPAVRWFTAAARQLAADRAAEAAPVAVTGQPRGDRVALQTVRTMGRLDRSEMQLAGCHSVSLHNPFLDGAVVDACLSVPAGERTLPLVPKPLLQAALARDVPPFVFARRTKGDFTADEYIGIRANAGELRELFGSSCLAELGLIRDVAVREVIDQAIAGFRFDLPAFDALIATEAWLRALSRDRTDNYWSKDLTVPA